MFPAFGFSGDRDMDDWPFDITKQITPLRRIEKEFQEAADEFAEPVGRTIWAWNYCHAAFLRLFTLTATPQNMLIGYAMWHTLKSDAAQRELLIAAAEVAFAKNYKILRRIDWAKRAGDSLSTIRNDAAHLATAWRTLPNPKIVPDPISTAPKRMRRVRAYEDLQKKLTLLQGDLIALCHFLSALSTVIAFPNLYPLPRRPKLRSIPESSLTSKKARRSKHEKRRRQASSSRA